jgi:Ni,Fe-hydrogenase III component G
MTRMDILEKIKNKFSKKVLKLFEKSKKRIYIDIDHDDLPDFATYIFKDLGARFNTASAVDTPKGIEILYHFTFDSIDLVVSLRVLLDKSDPHIASLTPIMKGAGWIEREMHELFGVEFDGHPDLRPLLLPDNWPKDKYPLRRNCKI